MKKITQYGFSLIELMVAILLGSILLLGVMQVMISSSTLGATTNNLAENQDTAKTVLGLLGGDAQRSGYVGCSATDHTIEWSNTSAGWAYAEAMVPVSSGANAPNKSFTKGTNDFGMRFNYALDEKVVNTADSAMLDSSKKSCLGQALYYRSVVYVNCKKDNVEGLCIQSTGKPDKDGNLADEFIPNVSLDKITFVVQATEGNFKEYIINGTGKDSAKTPKTDFSSVGAARQLDLLNAKLITFYITVKTASTGGSTEAIESVERQYSASYALKNTGNN